MNQIARISSSEFRKRLKDNPIEKVDKSEINRNLKDYLNLDEAILLVSGGIDSTVLWEYLLCNGTKVYPVYIRQKYTRGNLNGSTRSVKFFDKYFQKKYPGLSWPVKEMDVYTYPANILEEYRMIKPGKFFHHKYLLSQVVNNKMSFWLLPDILYQYPIYALQYSFYLKYRYDITVKTILTAILPTDGLTIKGQTLSRIRLYQDLIREIGDDTNFEYYSLFFEPQFGNWMEKEEVVEMGKKYCLPLEKTWSCTNGNKYPCGVCSSCKQRADVFERMKISRKKEKMTEKIFPEMKLRLGIRKSAEKLGEFWETMYVKIKDRLSD